MSASALVIGTVVVFTCFCAVVDLRTRRIPNALTGAALITGLSINFILFGLTGLLNSLSGLVILTAVLFTPFALGGIGGGDVKMMAAVGALLGPRLGLASLCAGVIIGGVVMAAHLLRYGQLLVTLARIKNMLVAAIGKAILYSSPSWHLPHSGTWQMEFMSTMATWLWLALIMLLPLTINLLPRSENSVHAT